MQESNNMRWVTNREVGCGHCDLYGMCRLSGLEEKDQSRLEAHVQRRKKVSNGENLIQAGEKLHYLYAVKAGMFKSTRYFDDGREQVVDFHLPGEMIGLESIGKNSHLNTVTALENSSVCAYSLDTLETSGGQRNIDYQRCLMISMTEKMQQMQEQSLLMGAQNAEQRISLFILNIARRFGQHGMPSDFFRLSMLRRDIANYLGLAFETVGRIFKKLEQQGFIETRGRLTQLRNIPELAQLAGIEPVYVQHGQIA